MDIAFLAGHILGTLVFLIFTMALVLSLLFIMWLPFTEIFPKEAERLKEHIRKRISRWLDKMDS